LFLLNYIYVLKEDEDFGILKKMAVSFEREREREREREQKPCQTSRGGLDSVRIWFFLQGKVNHVSMPYASRQKRQICFPGCDIDRRIYNKKSSDGNLRQPGIRITAGRNSAKKLMPGGKCSR
jgi:hypothetical protein